MDPTPKLYHYGAKCVSVHDGDSVRVDIDLGLSVFRKKEVLRLFGINAPEINKGHSKEAGKAATEFLKTLILDKDVIVETIKDRGDKYGRLLAKIYVQDLVGDWIYVNDMMVSSGHAVTYMAD